MAGLEVRVIRMHFIYVYKCQRANNKNWRGLKAKLVIHVSNEL